MGIRIRKVGGWGTQVSKELLDSIYNTLSNKGLEDYYTWLQSNYNPLSISDLPLIRSKLDIDKDFLKNKRFKDTVKIVDNEHSENDPYIVFMPVSMHDELYRYDDVLDHYENGGIIEEAKVTLLPNGIFPYDSSYMDKRTGESFSFEDRRWIEDIINIFSDDPDKIDELITKHGFSSINEYKANIVPDVPDAIKQMFDYLDFNGLIDVSDILPMLITYWG